MSTCAISGVVPEVPVVAKTTGYIFERRLILKHLELHQTCPISHTPLTTTDLLPIQTTSPIVPPRAPTQASLPQLLTTIQNEYDAMLLETFSLRQQLDLVKKDLAKQYYTLDAANRVIARLYKENKELREGLGAANPASRLIAQASSSSTTTSTPTAIPTPQISSALTFIPTQFIQSAIDNAREKLSGKTLRGVVNKQLVQQLPNSTNFLNPTISLDNTITLGGATTLLPQLAQTQFESTTLATLNDSKSTQQHTFIPTNTNSIAIITNDTATPHLPPTMTTIPLPVPPQHATVNVTAMTTTTLNTTQFPWLGNLINDDNMSDGAPSHFRSFIVSTSTTTNQHNIYIYAAPLASNSTTTTASSWRCLHTIKTNYPTKSLVIHPSQQLLLALSATTNSIDIYNIKQPAHSLDLTTDNYTGIISTIPAPVDAMDYGFPISIAVHPDCNLIGIGYTQQGTVQVYNCQSKTFSRFKPNSPTDFPYPVTQLDFPCNATHCVATSVGNGFQVFSLAKGNVVYTEQFKGLGSVTVDHTGTFILAAVKNQVHVYGMKDSAKVATITIPRDDFVIGKLSLQQDNKALIIIGQKEVFVVYPNLE